MDRKIISERVRGREERTFCGYGRFWSRNSCYWWKKWCVFGWKVGFATGLKKERWGRKVYRVLEKLYFDFMFFFFNIMLMWKIVSFRGFGYIYIYIYIDNYNCEFVIPNPKYFQAWVPITCMFHLAISFVFSSLKKHVSNHVNSAERHKGLVPMVSPVGSNRNFKKKMN